MKNTIFVLFIILATIPNQASAKKHKSIKVSTAMTTPAMTMAKVDCTVSDNTTTVTLTGNLSTYRYIFSDIPKNAGYVCLVAKRDEWKAQPTLCRAYRPDPKHVYTFGPMPAWSKKDGSFALIFRYHDIEHRINGANHLVVSGPCAVSGDIGVGFDSFAMTKFRSKP